MGNKPEQFGMGEEIKEIDGRRYRKKYSGYTIRQYFSHETAEKGPGPGWDFRKRALDEYGVDHPSKLPDVPYYEWEPVEDD